MPRAPFEQLPFAELPEQPRVPHAYHDAEARTVDLHSRPFGRMNVHLRTMGSGPPLLLVHGFMTSSYSWRYVLQPLSRHFTVYAADNPGAGRSDKPDRPYTPGALAEWLGELIDHLGIAGAPVIGNSLGGYLCMRLALRRPDAMGRLLNLHSPGVPTKRLYALDAVMRLPGTYGLVRRLVHWNVERWVHRNVHYYDETLKSREETREYAAALASDAGVLAFARQLAETLRPADMMAFVAELAAKRDGGEGFPIPLLLMYAQDDPMVPPVVGQKLRALVPDAQWVELAEASHFAHVDNPEAFLEPALAFLREP